MATDIPTMTNEQLTDVMMLLKEANEVGVAGMNKVADLLTTLYDHQHRLRERQDVIIARLDTLEDDIHG